MKRTHITILGMLVGVACVPLLGFAAAMSSSNYSIQSDSINIGGNLSSSTNYTVEDTVGEIATGNSESENYKVYAGYQQMASSYIAITSPGDVTMSAMSGIINGTSTGQATWTVTTDSSGGYSMTARASTVPALQGPLGAFFADYPPAGANPDYNYSIAASISAFGFSPEGTDIHADYKDNGSACGTGGTSDATDKCWNGFSTTDKTIAERTSPNTPSGTATTIKFRAENGANHVQDAGAYSASITVTAVAL